MQCLQTVVEFLHEGAANVPHAHRAADGAAGDATKDGTTSPPCFLSQLTCGREIQIGSLPARVLYIPETASNCMYGVVDVKELKVVNNYGYVAWLSDLLVGLLLAHLALTN